VAKAKRKAPDKDTLRELYLKSGNQCAFPACTRVMLNKDGVFVGQICHIEAAEEGGERASPLWLDSEYEPMCSFAGGPGPPERTA
jgi:hypothetical protein